MTEFLRRLWQFVRPYQTRLILGLLFGVLFALSNGALYEVVSLGVNQLFGHTDSASLPDHLLSKTPAFARETLRNLLAHLPQWKGSASEAGLILTICAIPIVMFFRSLFNYLNVYLVNWASARAIADLRTKTFAHLQNLPLGFFNSANSGDLMSRVTSDTQTVRTIIGSSISTLFRDPILIIFLFVLLMSKQPELTVISVVVLPLCLLPISIYNRKVRKSAKEVQTHTAELSKLMHESFTGNRVIKAYNLEDAVLAQFQQITRKFISQTMRVVRANEIPGSTMEFLGGVGVALVMLYVVAHKASSPGDLVGFVMSIYMMYQPMKSLTRLNNQLHQARAASQRVFELLDTTSSIVEPASPTPLQATHADIHFDSVDFDYGEKPVLREIDLHVKAGQFVALVGSSGSGKTTLTNLLLRFYDPQHGSICIGKTDIRQVSIRELRRQIALVTQETILFHDTIRYNIALGRPEATDAEIEAAARHANAHDFIMQKPQKYETVVGEKGVTLSGGQRQRIAIARAILRDAPILILDEATNALDAESERVVQEALNELMKNRTTICIAHRLSTIHKADLIVVLNEGRIVETGTHAELVRRGGVYQRLYELSTDTVAEPRALTAITK